MLFLHGYLSCKESFYYQIKFLTERGFRVVAPDIYGFGRSSPLTESFSVSDYALWLNEFIAKTVSSPYIVAHSFGARVAFKYLSTYPNDVKKLLVTGGAGIVKKRSLGYMWRVNAYKSVKKLFPKFAERHFGSKEYRSLSPIMKESYKKIVNEDLRADAEKITVPTLLVYGDCDSVTPKDEEGYIFSKVINRSRLITLHGGHFLFSENSDEFNGVMLNFFQE